MSGARLVDSCLVDGRLDDLLLVDGRLDLTNV